MSEADRELEYQEEGTWQLSDSSETLGEFGHGDASSGSRGTLYSATWYTNDTTTERPVSIFTQPWAEVVGTAWEPSVESQPPAGNVPLSQQEFQQRFVTAQPRPWSLVPTDGQVEAEFWFEEDGRVHFAEDSFSFPVEARALAEPQRTAFVEEVARILYQLLPWRRYPFGRQMFRLQVEVRSGRPVFVTLHDGQRQHCWPASSPQTEYAFLFGRPLPAEIGEAIREDILFLMELQDSWPAEQRRWFAEAVVRIARQLRRVAEQEAEVALMTLQELLRGTERTEFRRNIDQASQAVDDILAEGDEHRPMGLPAGIALLRLSPDVRRDALRNLVQYAGHDLPQNGVFPLRYVRDPEHGWGFVATGDSRGNLSLEDPEAFAEQLAETMERLLANPEARRRLEEGRDDEIEMSVVVSRGRPAIIYYGVVASSDPEMLSELRIALSVDADDRPAQPEREEGEGEEERSLLDVLRDAFRQGVESLHRQRERGRENPLLEEMRENPEETQHVVTAINDLVSSTLDHPSGWDMLERVDRDPPEGPDLPADEADYEFWEEGLEAAAPGEPPAIRPLPDRAAQRRRRFDNMRKNSRDSLAQEPSRDRTEP